MPSIPSVKMIEAASSSSLSAAACIRAVSISLAPPFRWETERRKSGR